MNETNRTSGPGLSAPEEPAEILYRGETLQVTRGTTVIELMKMHSHPDDGEVFAATVNNLVVSLDTPLVRSGAVHPIKYDSRAGARIYRRHLTLMLYEVFYANYPEGSIRVGQAISEGYYFETHGVMVNDRFLETIENGLNTLAAEQRPFVHRRVPVEEARRLFANRGTLVKKQILDTWHSSSVGIVSVGNFVDFGLGPAAPHTGYFNKFKLWQMGNDIVMQFPDPGKKGFKRIEGPQPKLYHTHKRSRRWSDLLGIAHVGDLNAACIDGSVREVIKVTEGLHEKKISDIADEIASRRERRLVLVAGPSSAGKTTFTKRLSVQLKVVGLQPVAISLDNYYVNRKDTPLDDNGKYDFEALEAIDLELFNEHLKKILNGEKVLQPRYDFNHGKRAPKSKWQPIQLGKDQVLIIEGIHGLNDALSPAVPTREKFRIYVNALNPLAIDEHNRLHTSDTRLIRRIVRDRHYRGYSAAETIHTWDSVRRGERKHIFPFQESADLIFDTSLIYEFSVLKVFAERYLLEVPRSDPAFAEAYRLRRFLFMFVPTLPGDVPQTSLMREFIGGSSFSY